MTNKTFDAVEMKRRLQKESEQKLSKFSEKEQLELLARKFGHLRKPKKTTRIA
ncbi:MAG: hypothetical protein KBH82_12835 [Syntrophorhabdaceae bacterium]|nr:hypothetical protein [Syntrophorhabdaceae bacterium]